MTVDSVGRRAAVYLDRACPQRRGGHPYPRGDAARPAGAGRARRTVTRTRAAGCGWLARARS